MCQTSLWIIQKRAETEINKKGRLPEISEYDGKNYLTTTCLIHLRTFSPSKKTPRTETISKAEYLGCSGQTIDGRPNGNNIKGGKHQPQTSFFGGKAGGKDGPIRRILPLRPRVAGQGRNMGKLASAHDIPSFRGRIRISVHFLETGSYQNRSFKINEGRAESLGFERGMANTVGSQQIGPRSQVSRRASEKGPQAFRRTGRDRSRQLYGRRNHRSEDTLREKAIHRH